MKLIEFDSPQILIDEGSDLVYFSSPHILETPVAYVPTPCTLCAEDRTLVTFIDWELNETSVCIPCWHLEMYHKLQQRKLNPYYYIKLEVARGYD